MGHRNLSMMTSTQPAHLDLDAVPPPPLCTAADIDNLGSARPSFRPSFISLDLVLDRWTDGQMNLFSLSLPPLFGLINVYMLTDPCSPHLLPSLIRSLPLHSFCPARSLPSSERVFWRQATTSAVALSFDSFPASTTAAATSRC